MTEQEIINILKENKYKGVADLYLPREVSDWIAENLNNSNLLYLDPMGNWKYFKDADFDDYDNIVFALPDMFNLPVAKAKDDWVEFEIDKNGYFNRGGFYETFKWWAWCDFLNLYSDDFTAFGGWQYKNCKAWFLQPMLSQEDTYIHSEFEGETYDCKPAIPVKIRFWREVK